VQGDRLTVSQRDHGIAGTIVGGVRLNVGEAGEAGVIDEIDLVCGNVEVIDGVMPDRLRATPLSQRFRTGA